jgi:hypothetical protein
MSLSNEVKACTQKPMRDIEQKITDMVRSALRKDFPIVKIAAQAIAPEVDVNFNAVNRWYNGLNAPISAHFLVLMKVSPSLFIAVLKEVGYEHVLSEIFLSGESVTRLKCFQSGNVKNQKTGPTNGPTNRESDDSLLRQRWFVDQIREGKAPSVLSIVHHWSVSRRKAKGDIVSLKERGVVAFVGAKKNGGYTLL